jgi:uncharacterized protein (DUF1697 family)
MQRWIALFRGINVGGNNILPMAALKSDLESLKLHRVRTYIQSGNVVFDSTSKSIGDLATRISRRIEEQHGFRPRVLFLSAKELQAAVSGNPFPEAVSVPKTLHFFFLDATPTEPNIKALDDAKASTENYALSNRVFYLHAPDGIGRSKLAMTAEKHLGVVGTGRNYRTVQKLLEMVSED